MRAFAHPSVFAVRSTGVARRFPSPLPRASRARLAVAARASSEDTSRPETSREARRDVHAPRSYTREYSVDGDESYSLLDTTQGFGPPDTAMAVGSTWGGGDDERPLDASSRSRLPAAWPDRPDVVTATSTHTRHPHVVSVKLPRPVADHIKFQPRTAPPLSSTFAELRDLDVNNSTDLEPTGAVVMEVNPGPPGLAFGLVQPGDILAVMVDEWKQPSDYFVRQAPFSEIERAIFERSDKPVTLRFERYVESETESIDTREFIESHVGDRTSVHHSHFT